MSNKKQIQDILSITQHKTVINTVTISKSLIIEIKCEPNIILPLVLNYSHKIQFYEYEKRTKSENKIFTSLIPLSHNFETDTPMDDLSDVIDIIENTFNVTLSEKQATHIDDYIFNLIQELDIQM